MAQCWLNVSRALFQVSLSTDYSMSPPNKFKVNIDAYYAYCMLDIPYHDIHYAPDNEADTSFAMFSSKFPTYMLWLPLDALQIIYFYDLVSCAIVSFSTVTVNKDAENIKVYMYMYEKLNAVGVDWLQSCVQSKSSWPKWSPFHRRYFQMYCCDWQVLHFD